VSAYAAAKVETKIVITGENNAKAAVAEARDGLEGMGEGAGNAEKGLRGVKDILAGQLQGPLQQASDLFGGIEAITQALPGTIGLVAAGITAAAAGAYLLYKHVSETNAKLENLGDKSTRALADQLNVSVDQAIKLQQALEDVPDKLRPATALLDVVRQRAESMGKDGAAAATKFAEALGKGPEALKAFEREFGRLSAASAALPDVAARLGLNAEALGIAEKVGAEGERARKAAEQAVALEREQQALAFGAAELAKQAAAATVVKSIELQKQSSLLSDLAVAAGRNAAAAVDEANALQAVVAKQQEAAEASSTRSRDSQLGAAKIAVLEAQGAAQLSTQARLKGQLAAQEARAAELARQRAALQDDYNAGLITELDYRLQLAGFNVAQANLVAKGEALRKQAAADQQARAQKGQQIADAEAAAKLRLLKIEVQTAEESIATLGNVHRLKLAQLALEERTELQKAARTANTAKGRAAETLAIQQEYAAKRRALDRAETDGANKASEETLAILQAQADRSRAIAAETTAAVESAAKTRTTSLAASLRAAGRDEQADLVELRQAHADYEAQLLQINGRISDQQAKFNAEDEDYKNLELQRIAQVSEARQRYEDLEAQAAERRLARKREEVAGAIERSAAGPADLLRGMGGEGARVADALSGVASGAATVVRNWGDLGKAAPGAISAVGAVASAFVSGEREKAGVMAAMEMAAAVVSVATEDYAGAAAHGAAAVLYGAVALGAIGGSSGAAAAGGSPGAFASQVTTSPAANDQQKGITQVYNINTPLVTRQDVAKVLSQGQRVLKTTGYAKSMGG
jgi:hypothetical protein